MDMSHSSPVLWAFWLLISLKFNKREQFWTYVLYDMKVSVVQSDGSMINAEALLVIIATGRLRHAGEFDSTGSHARRRFGTILRHGNLGPAIVDGGFTMRLRTLYCVGTRKFSSYDDIRRRDAMQSESPTLYGLGTRKFSSYDGVSKRDTNCIHCVVWIPENSLPMMILGLNAMQSESPTLYGLGTRKFASYDGVSTRDKVEGIYEVDTRGWQSPTLYGLGNRKFSSYDGVSRRTQSRRG
ncbi:hypothetical protein B0H16DRAFT_1459821 [Mycena metata]|uniref:Uncharacterized protein n=1 Tax=Mycena metata TaxID=1033252 RepID=A0AAD7NAK6_9AGAR|nr:hypothetical protein B0H16DRAFT_1459821 [Mycena metata]